MASWQKFCALMPFYETFVHMALGEQPNDLVQFPWLLTATKNICNVPESHVALIMLFRSISLQLEDGFEQVVDLLLKGQEAPKHVNSLIGYMGNLNVTLTIETQNPPTESHCDYLAGHFEGACKIESMLQVKCSVFNFLQGFCTLRDDYSICFVALEPLGKRLCESFHHGSVHDKKAALVNFLSYRTTPIEWYLAHYNLSVGVYKTSADAIEFVLDPAKRLVWFAGNVYFDPTIKGDLLCFTSHAEPKIQLCCCYNAQKKVWHSSVLALHPLGAWVVLDSFPCRMAIHSF